MRKASKVTTYGKSKKNKTASGSGVDVKSGENVDSGVANDRSSRRTGRTARHDIPAIKSSGSGRARTDSGRDDSSALAVVTVLSVKQPHAVHIVAGLKRIENRSWPTDHRGWLYIHASQSRDSHADKFYRAIFDLESRGPLPESEDLGAIIGRVEVLDCQRLDSIGTEAEDRRWLARHGLSPDQDLYLEGEFCWILGKAERFAEPIPARGRLGLWKFTLPEAR